MSHKSIVLLYTVKKLYLIQQKNMFVFVVKLLKKISKLSLNL